MKRLWVILFAFSIIFSQENQWQEKAIKMVKEQIALRGVSDLKLLEVLRKTPRHKFVPTEVSKYAYNDYPLPIGEGQTISQPYIVAFMTEVLDIDSNHRVLEIGTGSGYQAAVLSPLVKHVYTIEIVKSLANNTDNRLKILGYKNITIRWGDGYKGWPEEAPFDRIIVTAAPPEIPQALIEQLGIGGKMVLPVGTRLQEIVVVEKSESGEISKKKVLPVRFVPMIHGK
ncbi:uncharacterized protein METZ01_LOCUS458426 [marine metagenome]|uniref:protein-L-isoaspartate(D-aspartate) O-methyltransferase n=1 Tax=marine metagenome TaxID=408172 RepID=A0A383ACZ1_9ZZZZ